MGTLADILFTAAETIPLWRIPAAALIAGALIGILLLVESQR